MSEQERTARAVEARAAQKLTVNEAAELLRNEGRADTDIRERCRYWLRACSRTPTCADCWARTRSAGRARVLRA